MWPCGLVRVLQALVVECVVETFDQFQTDNTVVGRTVLSDGLPADFSREFVESVDAIRVEDFIYTTETGKC